MVLRAPPVRLYEIVARNSPRVVRGTWVVANKERLDPHDTPPSTIMHHHGMDVCAAVTSFENICDSQICMQMLCCSF